VFATYHGVRHPSTDESFIAVVVLLLKVMPCPKQIYSLRSCAVDESALLCYLLFMGTTPRNPAPTVDIIIETSPRQVVLIRRKNPPHGWALPGGFVDYGESLEHAAVREALEETGLEVCLVRQFHSYSDPSRDPRGHTITTVFIGRAQGMPVGADDAAEAQVFSIDDLPSPIVFDHQQILMDWTRGRY
jgi:8-oxo-dGTP diphosphatase